ncbi:molybdate transport system ATP-binding protein [Rhodoferax sp. OV413]|uniref:ABC transporter ATP-binding protein n=1 Tax=Rhodoferax sp. OV413 TaxID=1855285 RepID=UPI00088E9EF7|nr:ATP-binding cassette domain-containing protein [Rhodoferax sp. OV413]SDN95658.1 molybdate transport system ATP-binding protein [Rhodoferax sp. OV413]
MIDVDIQLTVADGRRRFDLAVRFASDVPFAALYGPSGAGKTLTLQAIAGLLRPSRGHIRIDGRTLFDSAAGIDVPASQRRVGYLPQNYALFPHLSVRQNIGFGLTSWRKRRLSSEEQSQVQSLLDSFGLNAMADSRPSSLSGGQQQRVALARALACAPQVLLLDEPFAALHPSLRLNLREELAQARRQWGIPALMITHDVEDVLALADVAFVFDQGQVVQEIHLMDASSRSLARQELGGAGPAEPTALQHKVRSLLLNR